MPTGLERLVWGFGDGSTMPVFDTEVGKIGAVICWENYMPLMRFHMYTQGIQIYLYSAFRLLRFLSRGLDDLSHQPATVPLCPRCGSRRRMEPHTEEEI